MSKKHFYVQHGLTVGNLSVDANSGNISTTGELLASKITTSVMQIAGELEFSDLNLTGNLSVGGDIDVQGVMSFSELDVNKLTVDTEVLIGSISIDGISGNVAANVAILDDLYLSGSHMEIVGNTILVNGNPISGGGGGTIDSNISVVSTVESQILNAGTTSITLANVVLTSSRPLVFVEGYSGQYYIDDFVVLDNTTIELVNPLADAGKVSVIQHQLSYVDENVISAFNAHEMQSDPHPQYAKKVDVGTCNVSVETDGVGGTTYSYPIDSSSTNFDFYSCSMKEDGNAWVVQTSTDVDIKWKVNSIEFTPATAGTYRFVYRDS